MRASLAKVGYYFSGTFPAASVRCCEHHAAIRPETLATTGLSRLRLGLCLCSDCSRARILPSGLYRLGSVVHGRPRNVVRVAMASHGLDDGS